MRAYVITNSLHHYRGEAQLHSFGVQLFSAETEGTDEGEWRYGPPAEMFRALTRTVILPWHRIKEVRL